jgi:hypothetical protein
VFGSARNTATRVRRALRIALRLLRKHRMHFGPAMSGSQSKTEIGPCNPDFRSSLITGPFACSLDYFIGTRDERRRYGKPQLLGCLELLSKMKFSWRAGDCVDNCPPTIHETAIPRAKKGAHRCAPIGIPKEYDVRADGGIKPKSAWRVKTTPRRDAPSKRRFGTTFGAEGSSISWIDIRALLRAP